MAAARQHQVQELVDAYLRQTGDLERFLQQVPADLRDEVQAQCREATFAAEFFRELPPLRLVQPLPHTIGGCELGELLGEGAMGRVLRGRQRELGRDVAVKLIRAEHQDHDEFLTRFREEARLLEAAKFMDAGECRTLLDAARNIQGKTAEQVCDALDRAGADVGRMAREKFQRRGEW